MSCSIYYIILISKFLVYRKIEIINKRLLLLRENKYKPIIDVFEGYNKPSGHFTRKAKEVRDYYLPGMFDPTTFDKGHFKLFVDIVKGNLGKYILSDTEREITKKEAIAENKFEIVNEKFSFTENLTTLIYTVKEILNDINHISFT